MANLNKSKHFLYKPLQPEVYGAPLKNPEQVLMHVVASDMDKMKFIQNKKDLVYRLPLDIRKPNKKSKYRAKKKYLSKKIRKENNLDKLPKTGWDYSSLQEMRNMWNTYMKKCLAFNNTGNSVIKAPDVTDKNYAHFHSILAKCELIGANIIVEQSNNPGYVGIEGTIVLETQQTFQIVTPKNQLKILLKQSSVFVFRVDTIQLTIFGSSLLIRPHERCVKKVKSYLKLDT